jgi:hypothetical protein
MNALFCGLTAWLGLVMLAAADVSPGQVATGSADGGGPPLPVGNPARVITSFHDAYVKQGRPRILVYVNRSLVADRGEMLALAEVERTIKVKGDEVPISGGNVQIGSGNEVTKPAGSGSQGGERQETTRASIRTTLDRPLGTEPLSEAEVRNMEEHFLRPLMQARARLVDQRVAELARRTFATPGANFLTVAESSAEQREIESLKQSVDVVVEVLARWRTVVIPEPSGEDRTERRISLTATATNLKDGIRLAQVGSDTLFGFNDRQGERQQRRYAVLTDKEIIEQTALALMEQMAAAE